MDDEEIIEIGVLKKHVRFFSLFANKYKLPIFKVNKKTSDGIELAKAALSSPVLEKFTEGIFSIYRGEDEVFDVDSKDIDNEDEDEDFNLPPKDKGEKVGKKEKEE